MGTPYDNGILWWHWKGEAVDDLTISDLAHHIYEHSPNATGIAVKITQGATWQGHYDDSKKSMAITGTGMVQQWQNALRLQGLQTHLWSVVNGDDPEAEADKLISACLVPGVSSLILDVESGDRYFGHKSPEIVTRLCRLLRQGLPQDFHLGLCCFASEDELAAIHLQHWLPYVDSLHPMIYYHDFSDGTQPAAPYIDEAVRLLNPSGKPLVPILGAYPDPTTGTFPSQQSLYDAAVYAYERGAAGLSVFRLGPPDVLQPATFDTLARLPLPDTAR